MPNLWRRNYLRLLLVHTFTSCALFISFFSLLQFCVFCLHHDIVWVNSPHVSVFHFNCTHLLTAIIINQFYVFSRVFPINFVRCKNPRSPRTNSHLERHTFLFLFGFSNDSIDNDKNTDKKFSHHR